MVAEVPVRRGAGEPASIFHQHGRVEIGAKPVEFTPLKETVLNDDQSVSAQMALASRVVRIFSENARQQLPWLRLKDAAQGGKQDGSQLYSDQKDVDQRLMATHVSGLLDAYADSEPSEVKAKRREREELVTEISGPDTLDNPVVTGSKLASWGDKADYLAGQIEALSPQIEAEREKVFSEAQEWGSDEFKNVRKEVKKTIRDLPKEQQEILEARTGISPVTMKRMLVEYGIPTAGSAAHYTLPEAATAGLAYVLSTKTPLLDIIPEHYDIRTASLAAAWAFLEYKWVKSMIKNVGAQTNLLDKLNTNSNIFAKGTYEIAKWLEQGSQGEGTKFNQVAANALSHVTPTKVKDFAEKVGPRKLAVAVGHMGPQVGTEIAYTAGFVEGVQHQVFTLDQGIFLCATANAIGWGVEAVQGLAQNYAANPENYTLEAIKERTKANVHRKVDKVVRRVTGKPRDVISGQVAEGEQSE